MNAAHVHLIVNHVPILGVIFALVLGLAGAGLRQPVLLRAALIGFVAVGVASLVAMKSGEEAEEMVEELSLPGVTHDGIHEHEEAAEWANYGALALAVGALVTLAFGWTEPPPRWATGLVLLGGVLVSILMIRTGTLGGEVRHTEIRSGVLAPVAEPATGS